MQDLEAIVGQLGAMAKAFKEGGLFLVLGLIVILAFLGFKAFLAYRKAAQSQAVTVNLPGPAPHPGSGNGSGKVCALHSGIEAEVAALERVAETSRRENSEQHRQLYEGLNANTAAISGLTAEIRK
jgi:hypothetical protein